MLHKYLSIADTPSVKAAQEFHGSRKTYARIDGEVGAGGQEAVQRDRLGEPEALFIASRDSFYLATVSETGWPYVQYRGGPAGFLAVLDEKTLAYADFRGNRQYISTGNISANNRVSLFLMDYARQRRLKIFARAEIKQAADAPELAERLTANGYPARIERVVIFHVAAFDWNCPQHITPRFTTAELAEALEPLKARLATLQDENKRLKAALTTTA